ncbi:MAG TPA: hypothetical protein PKE12_10950 [Kiritimatiellia bacterium]|nr:hypothetical protein [Kiritimatiellia bacterium]
MKRHRAAVLLCAATALGAGTASGDLVIDLDSITPGIQTTLSVASGASVTAIMYFDPTVSGPIAVNGFGIDMNWTPTGAGAATPSSPPLAGGLAGAPPTEVDIVSGTPIGPGSPLASAGAPPSAGTLSIGGVGYVDPTGTFFIGGPIPVPVDLYGVTFTVSGSPGDTITFTPSGILPPGVGSIPGIGPFISGGDPWQVAPSAPSPTLTDVVTSSVITIIPEPGSAVLCAVGLALLAARRQSHASHAHPCKHGTTNAVLDDISPRSHGIAPPQQAG